MVFCGNVSYWTLKRLVQNWDGELENLKVS